MIAFPSAASLDVKASVHAWHAIEVNDVVFEAPDNLPGADWDDFHFTVTLADGLIQDWEVGEALLTLEIDKASEYALLDQAGDRIAMWNSYEIVPMLKPHGGPFDFQQKEMARHRTISLSIAADGTIRGWPSSYERDQMNNAAWLGTADRDPNAPIGIERI